MNKFKNLVSLFFLVLSFLVLFSPQNVSAESTSLEFNPKKTSLIKGEKMEVFINLDPGGLEVIGVDLVLDYKPEYIKVLDVGDLGVFSLETAKIIDEEKGKIKYALSNSWGKYQISKASIARLIIEALVDSGQSEVSFVFNKEDTRDTNVVVAHGEDVLDRAENLSVKLTGEDKVEGTSVENESMEVFADSSLDKYSSVEGDRFGERNIQAGEKVKGLNNSSKYGSDNDILGEKVDMKGNDWLKWILTGGLVIGGVSLGYFLYQINL